MKTNDIVSVVVAITGTESAVYKLIDATLYQLGIYHRMPLATDIYLLPYVKENLHDLSSVDAIIIDLSVLKDTETEILEAIEAIRFFDDAIRIIIIGSSAKDCFKVMQQCFFNGIYNLILPDNYVHAQEQLVKVITDGMTYKDALIFRSLEEFNKKMLKSLSDNALASGRVIHFFGTQGHIGVTHCVLSAAYTLQRQGYIVAVVDACGDVDGTGSAYEKVAQSYDVETRDNFYTFEGIDIYPQSVSEEELGKMAYNYVLVDQGIYLDCLDNDDEKIIICGYKPWEMDYLGAVLRKCRDKSNIKYVFNLFYIGMNTNDLVKMMKSAGISENAVFVLDYLNDIFTESLQLRHILDAPVLEQTEKRRSLFSRWSNAKKENQNKKI